MAAPAFQTAGTLSGVAATSALVPVPSGVAANDIIVVWLYKENANAVTPPSGFTQKASQAATDHSAYLFWKRATGADSGTYSFSWTGSNWREADSLRISGCITTGDPFDTGTGAVVTNVNNTAGTASPAVSLTTTDVDRLLVWGATSFAGGAWTPPGTFTERTDISSDTTTATKTLAVAGASGSISGTCAGSGRMTAFLGALIPPAAAAAVAQVQPLVVPSLAATQSWIW